MRPYLFAAALLLVAGVATGMAWTEMGGEVLMRHKVRGIHVEDGRRTTVLRLGPAYCVNAGNALHAELRVLLGADAVF